MDGDVHLGCPTLVRARAQPVTDHLFEPADGRLGSGADGVSGRLLPSGSAVLGDVWRTSRFDMLKVAVPLRGRGLGRLAWHGCGTRRHDDCRFGMALGDRGGDVVLVVGAVGGERRDRCRHLVDQGADLEGVVDLLPGQRRGDDLAGVGVQADVQRPSGPARLGAVFLDQPLARAAQLEARAAHQQV